MLVQNLNIDLQSVRPSTPNMVMYEDDDPTAAVAAAARPASTKSIPPPPVTYTAPPDSMVDAPGKSLRVANTIK